MITVSPKAKIAKLVDIEDSVRGTKIIIEKDVVIDSFVKIKPVGGSGDIFIGKSSYINSGCVLYSGNGVKIGESVLIGPNCSLMPVNHNCYSKDRKIIEQRFAESKGGIIIEDDVWIGAGAIILDGALIRKGSVIGAGSLVNCETLPYSINLGVPIKNIGFRK